MIHPHTKRWKVVLALSALICVFSVVITPVTSAATSTPSSSTTALEASESSVSGFIPLTQLPGIQDAANSATLSSFLDQLYKICIGISAVLAVLMIMYAGVEFMTGQGSVTGNEKAKARIQNAILGLILVLSPTIVFSIINPAILDLDLNFKALQPKELNKYDTSAVGGGTPVTQDQINSCKQINPLKVVDAKEGEDRTKTCGAVGKGWASYPECCSALAPGKICCGYNKTNDVSPDAPITPKPEDVVGDFTFDWHLKEADYGDEDDGYCLTEHTEHFKTTKLCEDALATYKTARTKDKSVYATTNSCKGPKAIGTPEPAATYKSISNLHSCKE